MKPYYQDDTIRVLHGDCLDVLRELPDASVDAVVTDPPYGLEFMGKDWDAPWKASSVGRGVRVEAERSAEMTKQGKGHTTAAGPYLAARVDSVRVAGLPFQQWCEAWATECLRVLKPGGHLLAMGGSRTYHRLTSGVEDAGFEIRDCITYHFGSGFPKSLNVSTALDRIVPADARCVCGPRSTQTVPDSPSDYPSSHGSDDGQPQSAEGSGPTSAPSPADARERNRADRRSDAPGEAQANSPGGDSAHPSTADSLHPSELRSTTDQPSASAPSDTRTSTSAGPVEVPRRTAGRTPRTSGLAAGSASDSSWRNKHMACGVCGGVAIPQGLGTALKPATEFIVVARKPLTGTVAANVLTHGTGALNIAACRIAGDVPSVPQPDFKHVHGERTRLDAYARNGEMSAAPGGRWPANVVLDEDRAAALDTMSGETAPKPTRTGRKGGSNPNPMDWETRHTDETGTWPGDNGGGASRFFYTAKADAAERVRLDGTAHPTVKPLALMRWLVRLVTPPGGTVLEPFAGSGTTVEACILEGFRCVAIEREPDYLPLILQRIHRRRDPVQAVRATGDDGGLFDLLEDGGGAA